MNILLDTHAFLWLMADDDRLSPTAKKIFTDQNNQIYLSIATAWEMAIKSSLKKLHLSVPVDEYINNRIARHNIELVSLTLAHIRRVEFLPMHHRDPFDRLIISQCLVEKYRILTTDKAFSAYPVKTIW